MLCGIVCYTVFETFQVHFGTRIDMLVVSTERRLLTPVSCLRSKYKAHELETRQLDVTGNNPANVMLPLQKTA